MSYLHIDQLKKAYGDTEILKGINLDIEHNEFVVFVGPSGCGKSTLLRSIAGLEEVTSGNIYLGEKEITDLPPAKRDLAMVFQSYALYPHMSVRNNMSFALKLAHVDKDIIEKKVNDAAKTLELTHLLDRKPKDLSGGQRQRVAIGRSIVRNPKVFLFDEPLSNLDAALRIQMRLELAKLHKELKATMIYVTHDQVEAMTLADKVVVLDQGRIEQVGSPLELYTRPANKFVAGFLGMPRMSFLDGCVTQNEQDSLNVTLADGVDLKIPADGQSVQPGDLVTVGIRPEHIEVTEQTAGDLKATLEVAEHLGSDTFCYVKTGNNENITVRLHDEMSISDGETIGLQLNRAYCHVFNSKGEALRQLNQAAYN